MSSLRTLLAEHPNLLLIDSASARIQVALWAHGEARWKTSDTEAGTGVFACVDALLAETALTIAGIGAFVFCEGPGSVLGIRTAAVALRAWHVINPVAPLYSYQSLDLVARALNRPDVSVIADARRDSWHVVRADSKLQRTPTAALAGPLLMPEHFRHWTPLPATVVTTSYDLEKLLPQVNDADLFHPTNAPDAFLHEEPAYATWTAHVHQAPRTT